jgi:hypothetical protein
LIPRDTVNKTNVNQTINVNVDQQVENLVGYFRWERTTVFQGEVIIPSRKFGLETLIETYKNLGNQDGILQLAKQKLAREFGQ